MLEILFWVAVGLVIGWHVPQPAWAKAAFEKVKALVVKKDS